MKTEKKTFRIGHLANELGVERFVIRFWEKEFNVKPRRTMGGQRYYKKDELETFRLIKQLLYEKGFTIAGAKKILGSSDEGAIVPSQRTTLEAENTLVAIPHQLRQKLFQLKQQLERLQELL